MLKNEVVEKCERSDEIASKFLLISDNIEFNTRLHLMIHIVEIYGDTIYIANLLDFIINSKNYYGVYDFLSNSAVREKVQSDTEYILRGAQLIANIDNVEYKKYCALTTLIDPYVMQAGIEYATKVIEALNYSSQPKAYDIMKFAIDASVLGAEKQYVYDGLITMLSAQTSFESYYIRLFLTNYSMIKTGIDYAIPGAELLARVEEGKEFQLTFIFTFLERHRVEVDRPRILQMARRFLDANNFEEANNIFGELEDEVLEMELVSTKRNYR